MMLSEPKILQQQPLVMPATASSNAAGAGSVIDNGENGMISPNGPAFN